VFLEPYEQGLADEREAAAQVEAALADQPELTAAFETAREAAAEWQTVYAAPTLDRIARGGPASIDPADTEEGRRLFEEFRTAHDEFRAALLDERVAAVRRLDRLLLALGVLLAAGVLGLLAAGVLLSTSLRRWVTQPLEALGEQTRLVAGGAFDRRVVPDGPSEIARLGADIEAMRARIVEDLAMVANGRVQLEVANEQLQAQTAELERSNSDLEQFAYVASHDLQEPLRKISSFTQLLQKRYGGQLDERADQYIGFAVDGAKRMQVLINDLLAFSRVGRFDTETTEVDLDECLDVALQSLGTALEESGATVERSHLPVVRGEASLLTQVFQNLVGNALKFRGDAPPVVRIGARLDADAWAVTVADNGIGIDPQFADKVFVIFQRLHGRDEYTGTGIGLAMCRRIVEWHGGRIWLEPAEPGKAGATFTFTLPAAVTATAAPVDSPTDAEPPGATA
jgi:signal transduction histidine kinase